MEKTKKISNAIIGILVVACFAVCGLMLAACGGSGATTTKTAFKSVKDIYGFAGATSVNLLNAEIAANAFNLAAAGEADTSALQADASLLHKYLGIAEGFLGGKNLPQVTSGTPGGDYAATYAKMITVKVKGLDGTEETYVMYYNEKIGTTDTEADDEDEYEQNTKLTGILVYGDATYNVSGEKEVEKNEAEVKFIVEMQDGKKVIMEQEKEAEGLEYKYTIKNGEAVVNEVELEIETENNEIEFELTAKKDNVKTSYKLEQEKDADGNVYMQAELVGASTKTVMNIKVVEENGVKSYVYSTEDGTEISTFPITA